MNPTCYGYSEISFPKPDDYPVIWRFSYLRMANLASCGREAVHLSSGCLEDSISAGGSQAVDCNRYAPVDGLAAAMQTWNPLRQAGREHVNEAKPERAIHGGERSPGSPCMLALPH